MPYLEYKCPNGHTTERFYRSISEGEKHPTTDCTVCKTEAELIFSVPLGFGLYGNPAGYDKPSALKRHSTKLVSSLTGNTNAVG